jgi:hypothetical protein
MARRKNEKVRDGGTAEHIVSTAVGAAEALSVGVLRLTERTLIEAIHAVQDVGSELGGTVVRVARGSIKAAEEIGGDLAEVGRGVSRGVVEPARQVGEGVARMATSLWRPAERKDGVRKAPAKAAGRRTRRRAVA